ncbi:Cytochrome f, partial [Frankliniella fusca]
FLFRQPSCLLILVETLVSCFILPFWAKKNLAQGILIKFTKDIELHILIAISKFYRNCT